MKVLARYFCLALVVVFFATSPCFGRVVSVTWTASVSSNVSGYNLYYANVSGGPYHKINTSLITGTSTTVHEPVGTYYYVATAVDTGNNESVYSNQTTGLAVFSNCDINEDGNTDVKDVQLFANILTHIASCPTGESCDVNGDGKVNTVDLQAITNAVTKVSTCPY